MNSMGALEAPRFADVLGIAVHQPKFRRHLQKAGDNLCGMRRDICAAVWFASVR
jgi:hypothetical protein